MRSIISRQDEFIQWLNQKPSIDSVLSVFDSCFDKTVLCGSIPKPAYKALLMDIESERSLQLLIELIDNLALIQEERPDTYEDQELAGKGFDSFVDLVMSHEYRKATKNHSKALQVGEGLTAGFNRKFGHLLRASSETLIVDPFVGEKILKGERVVDWIIAEISGISRGEIRIVTSLPTPKEGQWARAGSRTKIEAMALSLERIQAGLPRPVRIHLDIYDNVPHNRYLNLAFSQGSLLCSIDHGVDAFRDNPYKELEPVNQLSADDFTGMTSSNKWSPKWGDLHETKFSRRSGESETIIRASRGYID